MTINERVTKEAKALGLTGGKVEQRVSIPGRIPITRDFIGIIDFIYVRPGIGVLGVQATSGANLAARRTKAIAEPRLRVWLETGCRFELWTFAKRGERGKRKLWQLRREEITVADLPMEPPAAKTPHGPDCGCPHCEVYWGPPKSVATLEPDCAARRAGEVVA
jgi:hypothetical protein